MKKLPIGDIVNMLILASFVYVMVVCAFVCPLWIKPLFGVAVVGFSLLLREVWRGPQP